MPNDCIVTIGLMDAKAASRLIEGMSLPMDMQPWREGLLRRLNRAIWEAEAGKGPSAGVDHAS